MRTSIQTGPGPGLALVSTSRQGVFVCFKSEKGKQDKFWEAMRNNRYGRGLCTKLTNAKEVLLFRLTFESLKKYV